MQEQEINQIIENNLALYSSGRSVFEIRAEIVAKIAEGLAKPYLTDDYWDMLRCILPLEATAFAFDFLQKTSDGCLVLGLGATEQLLSLYECCQKLCEFLIDYYDRAPEYVRFGIGKDALITAAADLEFERVAAHKDVVEHDAHTLPAARFERLCEIIRWTMISLMGEERYCLLIKEAHDAFLIVRAHPKCAHFFEEDEEDEED